MAGVTTGAVPSPLGNPQNLLIAASPGLEALFATFLYYLGPPTLIGLTAVLVLLRLAYPAVFGAPPSSPPAAPPDAGGGGRRDLPVLLSLMVLGSLLSWRGSRPASAEAYRRFRRLRSRSRPLPRSSSPARIDELLRRESTGARSSSSPGSS